jgi:hypothetical protein
MQAEMPEVRLGFVLHKERQDFYQNFRREIELGGARRARASGPTAKIIVRAVARAGGLRHPDPQAGGPATPSRPRR